MVVARGVYFCNTMVGGTDVDKPKVSIEERKTKGHKIREDKLRMRQLKR